MRPRQNSQYSSEISASGKAAGKWIFLSFAGQNLKSPKSKMNIPTLTGITGSKLKRNHQIFKIVSISVKNSTLFSQKIPPNVQWEPSAVDFANRHNTLQFSTSLIFLRRKKKKNWNKILGVTEILWRAAVRAGLWSHSTNSTAKGSVLPQNPEPAAQGSRRIWELGMEPLGTAPSPVCDAARPWSAAVPGPERGTRSRSCS